MGFAGLLFPDGNHCRRYLDNQVGDHCARTWIYFWGSALSFSSMLPSMLALRCDLDAGSGATEDQIATRAGA